MFIPIAVGGESNASDASELLHSGADKVCINTAAVNRPKLITELAKDLDLNVNVNRAKKFRITDGGFYSQWKRKNWTRCFDWIRKAIKLGVVKFCLLQLTQRDEKGLILT